MINTTALANFLAQRRMRFGKEEENKMYVEINGVKYYLYYFSSLHLTGIVDLGESQQELHGGGFIVLSKHLIEDDEGTTGIIAILNNSYSFETPLYNMGDVKLWLFFFDSSNGIGITCVDDDIEDYKLTTANIDSAEILCLQNGESISY